MPIAMRLIVLLLVGSCAGVGCRENPAPALAVLADARKVSSELRLHYSQADGATDRAVLADTDEISTEFAQEARSQLDNVAQGTDKLESLLKGLPPTHEPALVSDFRAAFAKCRAVDDEILKLAVENTNVKAQRLSFGEGEKAARDFAAALTTATAGTKDNAALVANALLGVREMQVLEAPHIAAIDEVVMAQYEKDMGAALARSNSALDELAKHVEPATLAAARGALARFMGVHQEILALSHRNTDVRSLALALGQKRKLTAVCEAKLDAISEELQRRSFPATR